MPLPQPRSAVLVAAAWVAACATAVLAGVALTLAPAEQARAWPLPAELPGGAAAVGPVAAVAAGVAVLLLVAAAGHVRARRWEVPFAGLVLVYPLLLAGVWFVLGAGAPRTPAYAMGGLAAAALALLARRGPRPPRPAPASGWRGDRRWWAADLLMILAPVAVGLALGARPDPRALIVSLAGYPLFAALQLAVFLVLPARRLRAMGLGPTGTALACALVFGLLHWPQPLVFTLTGAGLFVWTAAWLRGRPFWQLALVMGLAATTVTQFLPDAWTGHMNVGPRAVRQLAVRDLAQDPGPHAVDAGDWLTAAYPRTVGRRAAPDELARWRQALAGERAVQIAWEMQLSPEYARLAAAGARPAPPPALAHWRDLPAPWAAALAAWGRPDGPAEADLPPAERLAALYRGILGRDPEPGAAEAWSWGVGPLQRTWLARYLLENRWRLARTAWSPEAFPPLRVPRQ